LRQFLLLAFGLLSTGLLHADEREANWRQDIEFMIDGLGATGRTVDLQRGISTRGQIDFAKLYPAAPLHAALETLYADIPRVPDSEIVLQIMRLIAMAHVAHNTVHLPLNLGFYDRLPVFFRWYSDGLAVIAASPEYSDDLGARVLSMGGKEPIQLLSELAPYVSHENDVWLRQQSPQLLRTAAALRHLDLLNADGKVSMTLQKGQAPPFTIQMKPGDPNPPQRLLLTDTLHVPTPLFRSQSKAYWYQYLEDSQTFYIQYNQCANDPKFRFSEFAAKALADLDSHPVRRVVIDLRQNGGGDSGIISPLQRGLASRLKKVGPVYVIIGASTFSSAELNAIDLHRILHAKLVGEPTGGKPNSYGEIKTLTLPNSKLVVQYTSKWFGSSHEDPAALQPDIPAPYSLADLIAGRDPSLAAAISAAH
jgi:hypothetical protein